MLAELILTLETRAARLAATLDARPALGALWRRMLALSEASASLGLEDVAVRESDILRSGLGLGPLRGDPQSVHAARAIHQFLLRPGGLRDDPAAIFNRAVGAARMTTLVDQDIGGRVDYPGRSETDEWRHAAQKFALAAHRARTSKAPPLLRALGLTRIGADLMPEPIPAAERLLLVAAEHQFRLDLRLSDPIVSHPLEGIDRRVDAAWVCTPSLALSRGGYRTWSPHSPHGSETLLHRLSATLGREAGRLAHLNSWMAALDGFSGQTRKSRKPALARLMLTTPVLGTATIAGALDVTQRTALNLIGDAEAAGLVQPLTRRRHYRLWAIPALARMIAERPVTPRLDARRDREQPRTGSPEAHRPLREAGDFDARVAAAYAEIDRAMSGIDDVVRKYRGDDD